MSGPSFGVEPLGGERAHLDTAAGVGFFTLTRPLGDGTVSAGIAFVFTDAAGNAMRAVAIPVIATDPSLGACLDACVDEAVELADLYQREGVDAVEARVRAHPTIGGLPRGNPAEARGLAEQVLGRPIDEAVCPGCGRRIYGVIARRGACTACYPELPPATVDRDPYVGEGADGARRSAQIDREEADTLDRGDPRRAELEASSAAWEAQADRLDLDAAIDHVERVDLAQDDNLEGGA